MKPLLLLPVVGFFAIATFLAPTHAIAGDCDSAKGTTTPSCTAALTKISNYAHDLDTCLADLKDEYFGVGKSCPSWKGSWECDGAGPKFRTKKMECKTYADKIWGSLDNAYVPGGDTSPRRFLKALRKELAQ
jgi:hypothetical protein